MFNLRTSLFSLLILGTLLGPMFAGEEPAPCEQLSIVNTKIVGSSLYVTVSNPTLTDVDAFIRGNVHAGGESVVFYAPISVPSGTIVTYELEFDDPINVLVWIKTACEGFQASTEGPDPILIIPTIVPESGS